MDDHASIEGDLECDPGNEETLAHIAESVDKFVDAEPRHGGYSLAASISAILNGGTHEQIGTALRLLKSWSFRPKGGW